MPYDAQGRWIEENEWQQMMREQAAQRVQAFNRYNDVPTSFYPNQAAPYGSFPYADPTPSIWDSSPERVRQDVEPQYRQPWMFNQEPIADTSAISDVPQMAMTRFERSKLQLPIGPFTPLPDFNVPAFTPVGPTQEVPAHIRQTIPTANDPTGGLSATDPNLQGVTPYSQASVLGDIFGTGVGIIDEGPFVPNNPISVLDKIFVNEPSLNWDRIRNLPETVVPNILDVIMPTAGADTNVEGADPDYGDTGMGDAGPGHPGLGMQGPQWDTSAVSAVAPFTGTDSVFTGDEVDVASRAGGGGGGGTRPIKDLIETLPIAPGYGTKTPWSEIIGNTLGASSPTIGATHLPVTWALPIAAAVAMANMGGEDSDPDYGTTGMGDTGPGHPGMADPTPTGPNVDDFSDIPAPVPTLSPTVPAYTGPTKAELQAAAAAQRKADLAAQKAAAAATRELTRLRNLQTAQDKARQKRDADRRASAKAAAKALLAKAKSSDKGGYSDREINAAIEIAHEIDTFGSGGQVDRMGPTGGRGGEGPGGRSHGGGYHGR